MIFCVFCGSSRLSDKWFEGNVENPHFFAIGCDNCGAHGPIRKSVALAYDAYQVASEKVGRYEHLIDLETGETSHRLIDRWQKEARPEGKF